MRLVILAAIAAALVISTSAFNRPGPSAGRPVPRLKSPTSNPEHRRQRPLGAVRLCRDDRVGLVWYRTATWRWQAERFSKLAGPGPRARGHSCGFVRAGAREWRGRAIASRAATERWRAAMSEPERAICFTFGPDCEEALDVADCESHLHTTSANGQYLGLFQMGSYARQLYGHSTSALGQAIAAHRYFVASGRDWSPWSCKPGVSSGG